MRIVTRGARAWCSSLAVAAAVVPRAQGALDRRTPRRSAPRPSTVASQFALRMDNVDGTDFDDYIKRVKQLLTTKAKTETTRVRAVQAGYAPAKVKGTGKVLLTGVGDLDADSATVLVAHDASVNDHPGRHRAPLPLDGRPGEGRRQVARRRLQPGELRGGAT